ncbi:hypothetical protein SAMN05444422_101551 [Halobiforma haloterrestris]|uniref:Halobacterial output domain-containing protein n=1 Tax=Natronobacterium haloterrestre TaxID=148448 RepID=A0A1I1DE98_NATHA|nr:HalOD1 output domain-containing protein [Halobiforma haloterrestris]SFB73144.1 hypothetical protein SAMN05444422_101551 [Halobiforma haloterrestris]
MSGTPPTERLTPFDDSTGRTVYYDSATDTYRIWCVEGDYEPVSTAVLVAVASIRGVEPDELEPLPSAVDPDALNSLVEHWHTHDGDAMGSISFTFADCEVTVSADGEIEIDAAAVPVRARA